MVVPLLAIVPQQGVALDFKSRQSLTRLFVLFFLIISSGIELINNMIEFGVPQCDVTRRPAIVVYHLVWNGYHSDNATIIHER